MTTLEATGNLIGPSFEDPHFLEFEKSQSHKGRGRYSNTPGDLKRHVMGIFGTKLTDHITASFLDRLYYFPHPEEVQAILARSIISRLAYKDNRFDCDDFAFGVKGEFSLYAYRHPSLKDYAICFGVIMGIFAWQRSAENHAACFFVGADQSVYLVEPRQPWRQLAASGIASPPRINPWDIILHPVDDCDQCFFLMV